MTVFGDTAIHFILVDGTGGFAETVQGDSSLALFAFLEQFWSGVVSIVAIAMVAVFFVTSADSARWWWTCWPRAAPSARPCCSGSSGRC